MNGVARMASRRILYVGLVVVSAALVSTAGAADPAPRTVPAVADTMKFFPTQKDVEFETPKASEFAKCKVEKEIKTLLVESCDSSMRTFKEENRISLNDN